MEKIDARTLSPEAQHEIRKQVVRLRKQGLTNKMVARGVGISESHASTIWQSYKREGSKAISLGQRGRRPGEKRHLTREQEAEVKRALIDMTPDQLKFPFALWTRDAVRMLIGRLYGLEMPIRTDAVHDVPGGDEHPFADPVHGPAHPGCEAEGVSHSGQSERSSQQTRQTLA